VPDISKPIPDLLYTVNKKDKDKTIVINLANSENGGVGQLVFAPNMLRPGWNVSITSTDDSSMRSSNSDCGDNELEAVSPVLEIRVTDDKGRPVKHFEKSFQLSLYAVLKDGDLTKDACLGYSNNKQEGWKCDGVTNFNSTGSSSVFLVDTTSDHLTSFAVFLGGAGGLGESGCEWSWVQVASLVMIGCAVSFTVVINGLYCAVPAFRSFLGGSNEEAVMKRIRRATVSSYQQSMMNKEPIQV